MSQESTGNPPTITYHYQLYPVPDGNDAQAIAYSLTAPSVVSAYGLLFRQDIKCDPEASDQWHITVPYAKEEKQTGSYTLSFDTTGGTINKKASYRTAGKYPAGSPDYKGSIDVQHDGTVNGCDVPIPALKLSVRFSHPTGFISLAQIRAIARAHGKVNSTTMMTFDAGEVLFLGATGSEGSNADTEVTYQLVCSENATNLTVGTITGITKAGHDYAWIRFKPETDANKPVYQPEAVYVEEVHLREDLKSVLGFG